MSRKLFLVLIGVLLASAAAWWWVDSALTCNEQDAYTLRGVCLIRVRAKAEANDVGAQWFYGQYLIGRDKRAEGYGWLRRSVANATKGVELSAVPGLCGQAPGFDAEFIESRIMEVAKRSPDAHLPLVQLYMNTNCEAFDLGKAARQIPMLTQCAALTLDDFLSAAERAKVPIRRETAQAINANLAYCRLDLHKSYQRGSLSAYSEIVRPQMNEITALERRVAPLLGTPAQ